MDDRALTELVRSLTGTDPTAEQVAIAHRLRERFRFSESDPVWAFLLVMGHYQSLLEQAPREVTAAIITAIEAAKASAEIERHAIAERVRSDLLGSLDAGLATSMRRISSHLGWRQLATGISIAFVSLILAIALAFHSGGEVALADAKANQAWLDSPPGQAAQALAKLNDVQGMMSCAAYELIEDNGKTFCRPVRDRLIYGWRVR